MVAELVDKSIKNVELPQQQVQREVTPKPVTPPPFGNPTVPNQLQQVPNTQPQITPPPFGNQQVVPQQPQQQPQHQYTPNPFK